MEIYNLVNDIPVFEFQLKTFPSGISEAFDELIKKTGDIAGDRSYFGIIKPGNEGKTCYFVAAEEKEPGEAEKFNYDTYTIESGEYLITRINDWRTKTGSIKDVFHEIFQDSRVDKKMPCVEWYKNENEMLCMVKTTRSKTNTDKQ